MTPQPRYDLVGAERRGTGKTWEDGQILEFQSHGLFGPPKMGRAFCCNSETPKTLAIDFVSREFHKFAYIDKFGLIGVIAYFGMLPIAATPRKAHQVAWPMVVQPWPPKPGSHQQVVRGMELGG